MLRDFDFAVDDYWDWFEARQNEQKPVPAHDEPPKGMTWGPKYDTLEEIFDKFTQNLTRSHDTPIEDLIDQDLLESEFGAFMADDEDY